MIHKKSKDEKNVSAESRKPTIEFMMNYVKRYLDGKSKRFAFELDFKYHLLNLWDDMCEEDFNHAKAFKYYIGDNGFEAGEELNDTKYKELIRQQYMKVEKIAAKGFNKPEGTIKK